MKFSWSPKALLSAALNEARFKMNNEVCFLLSFRSLPSSSNRPKSITPIQMHHIPGPSLLSSHFPSVPITPGFALEGLANRNSLPYASSYSLGPLEGLETVFRGTLRYKGFSKLLNAMRGMGLLSSDKESTMSVRRWDELGVRAIERSGMQGFGRDVEDGLAA